MATATKLLLTPALMGTYSTPPLSNASASKATELLQENHKKYHMYFNEDGFHNHLAHHLLALYALNAPPDVLKRQYDDNTDYQLSMTPVDHSILQNLEEPTKFKQYLFQRDHYHDYLALFESEIEKLGWPAVLNKYLFAGDSRANDMLDRLWGGILHPLIVLGYGVEWQQPALIAEALAMCATHDDYLSALFVPASAQASSSGPSSRTLLSLIEEAAGNLELRSSVTENLAIRMRDGVLGPGKALMTKLASQYTVAADEAEIEAKLAELANVSAYVLAAAQHPRHTVSFDFVFLHCINSIPVLDSLVRCKELDIKHRCEVLERSGRFLLATFVGQCSPTLYLDERVRGYEPRKKGKEGEWEGLTERVFRGKDDSHVIKCLRALRHGEQICGKFEGEGFPLKEKDWLKVGNMLADVAEENDTDRFVSPSGWDQPWDRRVGLGRVTI